jgi:hypothetical protein
MVKDQGIMEILRCSFKYAGSRTSLVYHGSEIGLDTPLEVGIQDHSKASPRTII